MRANCAADFTANIGVDFVKHQHRYPILPGQHGLGGQHDPRNFTAGCNHAQGAHILAGIGRKTEFDLIHAGRPRLTGINLHIKETVLKADIHQFARDAFRKMVSNVFTLFAQHVARLFNILQHRSQLRLQFLPAFISTTQVAQLLRPLFAVGQNLLNRDPIFRFSV